MIEIPVALIVFGAVCLWFDYALADLGLEPDRPHVKVLELPAPAVWSFCDPLEGLDFTTPAEGIAA